MASVELPGLVEDGHRELAAAALLREITRYTARPENFPAFRAYLMARTRDGAISQHMTPELLSTLSDSIRDGIVKKLAGSN